MNRRFKNWLKARERSARLAKRTIFGWLSTSCAFWLFFMARDWLMGANHWLDGFFQKEIARRLGISSGALGSLYFLVHTVWPILHANTKKKQKRDEEEKKQFSPRYNPIEERNSESWSDEQHHD